MNAPLTEEKQTPAQPVKRNRFSLAIRLYAVAAGKTMRDIAEELGISQSMLHCIMEGKRDPGRAFRTLLSEWLLDEGEL